MNNELKRTGGKCRGLIKVLSQHLPGRHGENYEKRQGNWCLSQDSNQICSITPTPVCLVFVLILGCDGLTNFSIDLLNRAFLFWSENVLSMHVCVYLKTLMMSCTAVKSENNKESHRRFGDM
jgi:hypothetical protein